MIIWSGWGILSALFAIIGIVVGVLAGSFAGALAGGIVGGGLAAFLNHLVAKSAGKGKIMIDPETNQQVLLKKSNSLFFIPMTWFTPILAAGGVLFGVLGMVATGHDKAMDEKYPGKVVFDEADASINSTRDGATATGNTEAAIEAARQFASTLKAIQAVAFEGGSKKNLMTKGEFLTYCHQSKDGVTFLCHVPSLRSYKDDEAKEALDLIAWQAASGAAVGIPGLSETSTLAVGLRGISSYGSIRQGALNSEDVGAKVSKESLYEIFDPANEPAS